MAQLFDRDTHRLIVDIHITLYACFTRQKGGEGKPFIVFKDYYTSDFGRRIYVCWSYTTGFFTLAGTWLIKNCEAVSMSSTMDLWNIFENTFGNPIQPVQNMEVITDGNNE